MDFVRVTFILVETSFRINLVPIKHQIGCCEEVQLERGK